MVSAAYFSEPFEKSNLVVVNATDDWEKGSKQVQAELGLDKYYTRISEWPADLNLSGKAVLYIAHSDAKATEQAFE